MVKRHRTKPKAPASPNPDPAYAPALKTAAQALTTRVQEMHTAISDKTFRAVQAIPGLAAPAGLVQRAHDAIAGGVYAAVRGGAAAAMLLAAEAERLFRDGARPPEGRELALRSALNAAAGDALAEAHSALAVRMTLHAQAQVLDDACAPALWAALGPRVVVFIHGLACDEQSWRLFGEAWQESAWPGEGVHYGALLERELSISPLYLRYNTGLSIHDNARDLGKQLERLAARAPQVRELVLVGHSMGGLVARAACEEAAADSLWRTRVGCVICLGSPHRGAPLEQLGQFVSAALGVSEVTRPLQTLANARSRGVRDLRRGLAEPTHPEPALRLVAGSLGQAASAGGRMLRAALGDGLVTVRSALDERVSGDVQRAELPGLGHMALLNHPRVYLLLRQWLTDASRG
jgi:pimeloyl-ACP methyl ester carboxylesterase